MDRLLVLRLDARGCAVEAFINDIPVGGAGPSIPTLCLPVHEYVVEGANEIRLVVEPTSVAPLPVVADGEVGATMRLLLPRMGQVASDELARTVAELAWAVPDGGVYEPGHSVSREVVLPIRFPRWRWLDVPLIEEPEAHRRTVASFLHRIAAGMVRGEFQPLLTGSRLRLEELALAYQQPVAEVATRLVTTLRGLHTAKALKLDLPAESDMVLRRCAGGRLLDCLDRTGAPVLRTLAWPGGRSFAWPTRLAVVDGHCHIFR
jgi:hypothetical protein